MITKITGYFTFLLHAISVERTWDLEERLKKQERRIQAGVCIKCHRTFQNVRRHMVSKHGEGTR